MCGRGKRCPRGVTLFELHGRQLVSAFESKTDWILSELIAKTKHKLHHSCLKMIQVQ